MKIAICDDEKPFMDALSPLLEQWAESFSPPPYSTEQTNSGFCKIVVDDVDYLEAQNKQALVCLSDGKTIAIRELFSKCEESFHWKKGFSAATAATLSIV